jgi:xylan 1,4-beta-xylosidase
MTSTDPRERPEPATTSAVAAALPRLPWRGATNPVLPGFHPDPSVCRVDDDDGTWYYLVTSTFEYLPGLPVYRSRDLVAWELVGHALHRAGQVDLSSVRDSGGMFAPTIRHDGSRFLVLCTLVDGPAGASGNLVVTAHDAAGPWSDPVWWHDEGIDPSLRVDDDGRLWAHGTRGAQPQEWEQQTSVWVRELDRESLRLVGEERVVWSGAVRGAVWAEGPHLVRRDGRVYLLASEGGTAFHHAVSVARADSTLGPYEGYPGNPVLTHRHLGHGSEVVNVGHADLVDAPDGSTWAVALATRPVGGTDLLGRETFVLPVEWQDGWPVFAPGVGRLVPDPGHPAPRGAPQSGGTPQPLLAVRQHPEEIAETGPDDRLTLTAGPGLSERLPAFVGRRLADLPVRVELTVEDVPDGATAAVALRYSSTAWVSLSVGPRGSATEVVATTCEGGDEHVLAAVTVPGPPRGGLILDLDGLEAVATWSPEAGTDVPAATFRLDELGAAASGGFVGVVYGVLAEGTGVVRVRGLRATSAGADRDRSSPARREQDA